MKDKYYDIMDEEIKYDENSLIYIENLKLIGYKESQIYKIIEKDELTKELYERLIEEKETSTKKDKTGHIKFKKVYHQERAKKLGRISDGNTSAYLNIALEYFNYRCALSGEKFESFEDEKVENSFAKNNLSAEHIVPLCQGGDDVFPNLVPSVLQYNISKNGYNLLDWWTKQKDIEGKELYSPYRLLKLINYMMKSIDSRNKELTIKQYEKAILAPNEIDIFLNRIEKQDELQEDNSKRKILSDTITTTEITNDGKKILQTIPGVDGNIPKQTEQQNEKNDDICAIDIFLSDAINMLNSDKEFIKNDNYKQIISTLNKLYKDVVGVIPFEVEIKNKILNNLEQFGIKENKYTVANELLHNTELLNVSKENPDKSNELIMQYFIEKEEKLMNEFGLTHEQIKIGMSNVPAILYDNKIIEFINLYKKYIKNDINIEIIDKEYLQNSLKIKEWMEKNNTTKPPRQQDKNKAIPAEEATLGSALSTMRKKIINPYLNLKNEEEKKKFKEEYPEVEYVIEIIQEIDKHNIKFKEDSQYYWNILEIKEWMEKKHTTNPPRARGKNKSISDEENDLGCKLSAIRQQLLKPFFELKTEDEQKEFKKNHPELEIVLEMVKEIDDNNKSIYLRNAIQIKEWMEENNTTKPPRQQDRGKTIPSEEAKLGNALSSIRRFFIKPFLQLKTEEDKEKYRQKYPDIDEIMEIIQKIDENNIPAFLNNILEIKKWMEDNQTTRPPRQQNKNKTVPVEEATLGCNLSTIRQNLIRPYLNLKSEGEKEEYKKKHPELEEVMTIVEEIDSGKNKMKKNLKQIVVEGKDKIFEDNHRTEKLFNETIRESERLLVKENGER